MLLDCELICFGEDGRPDFARLRSSLGSGHERAAQAATTAPATLVVFDVLHLDGHAVRRLPYRRRRDLLDELGLHGEHWTTPRVYLAGHDDLQKATRAHGLEGIVAQRYSAPYVECRRSAAWRKLRNRHVETLLVTAWEPGVGRGDELLVSRPDPESGELRHAGRVPLRQPVFAGSLAAPELRQRPRFLGWWPGRPSLNLDGCS